MSTEITVQAICKIEDVMKKIEDIGYVLTETLIGSDSYFSLISKEEIENASYSQLLNSSLIIRAFKMVQKNIEKVELLHKSKVLDEDGNVISEKKSSVSIENKDKAKEVLSMTGMINWIDFNQKNHFYKKDDITIIVGEVEGLEGTFIEIESYKSIENETPENQFEILKKLVDSLGFETTGDYSCKKCYMLYQKNMFCKNHC